MSIRQHSEASCWEIVDAVTGTHGDYEEEGWPHYTTRAEAAAEIGARVARHHNNPWADEPLLLKTVESYGGPCVGVFCDGCNTEFDFNDGGWTHLDPLDPMPFTDITDMDWVEVGALHYCDTCAPPWCEDCDERHALGSVCPAATSPLPKAIPVLPGQLELIEVSL